MRKLAVAQLGSVELNQETFKLELKLQSIKKLLPFLIQKHYEKCKNKKLLKWKEKFKQLERLDEALQKEFCNYDYYGDEWLNLVADTILQTLVNLKSPGCKFLYLIK